MEVCFRYGGREHCFVVPVVEVPIKWPHPGPGPVNYPQFLQDAMIVAAIQDLATLAGDEHLREALNRGVAAGVEAMQRHVGPDVTIRAGAAKG